MEPTDEGVAGIKAALGHAGTEGCLVMAGQMRGNGYAYRLQWHSLHAGRAVSRYFLYNFTIVLFIIYSLNPNVYKISKLKNKHNAPT